MQLKEEKNKQKLKTTHIENNIALSLKNSWKTTNNWIKNK